MASHRMLDSDRPRRAVPAWVTAPYVDDDASGREARPDPRTSAPVEDVVAPDTAAAEAGTTALAAPEVTEPLDVVVPDFPPDEDLLPPAPTSPAVHTMPITSAPAPAATTVTPPSPAAVVPPRVGEPRFSVPGLEHVVVQGVEPEPEGPIGYRTPRRFAHQQAPATVSPPAPRHETPEVPTLVPVSAPAPTSILPAAGAPPAAGTEHPHDAVATGHGTTVTDPDGAVTGLPSGAPTDGPARRPAIGATPGALLGAVAALGALALAAWWFTAPATVHAVGLALGVLGVLLSVVTLRNRTATWQRSVALLGVVLGSVGTLGLLWAVAAALLPLAGVTLPDLTGSGTTPTLAP